MSTTAWLDNGGNGDATSIRTKNLRLRRSWAYPPGPILNVISMGCQWTKSPRRRAGMRSSLQTIGHCDLWYAFHVDPFHLVAGVINFATFAGIKKSMHNKCFFEVWIFFMKLFNISTTEDFATC